MKFDARHLPFAMQIGTWALLVWLTQTGREQIDRAIAAANRLPVVEQQISEQGRRIDRLEKLDEKLDKLAEGVAGLMAEVKRKP